MHGDPLSAIRLTVIPYTKLSSSESATSGTRRVSATIQKELSKALRQTESRLDGMFFFLDCPSGKYMLRGKDARSGAQAEQIVSVGKSVMSKHVEKRTKEEGYQIELVLTIAT
jgi:hypothetical protein